MWFSRNKEKSLIEFGRQIEELTNHKVCFNITNDYRLDIYNWLYKNNKKTCFRCDNCYITIYDSFPRTEENAIMIANKCLLYADFENYGNNYKVPIDIYR